MPVAFKEVKPGYYRADLSDGRRAVIERGVTRKWWWWIVIDSESRAIGGGRAVLLLDAQDAVAQATKKEQKS